jgi:hypothetical protein
MHLKSMCPFSWAVEHSWGTVGKVQRCSLRGWPFVLLIPGDRNVEVTHLDSGYTVDLDKGRPNTRKPGRRLCQALGRR